MSQIRRQWCAMLAKLVAPMDAETAARAFVDMLPMLPADETLYTRRTLESAATCARRTAVPTYEDIANTLGRAGVARLPVSVRMGYKPPETLLEAPRETAAEREATLARHQSALAQFRAAAVAKRRTSPFFSK